MPAPTTTTSVCSGSSGATQAVGAYSAKSTLGSPPAFSMASRTAAMTAIELMVAPDMVSTFTLWASTMRPGRVLQGQVPTPSVSSQRMHLQLAMAPPRKVVSM